ncbi:hypothetical protein GCM10022206_14170 [Streptomyces chiangmaiensis]
MCGVGLQPKGGATEVGGYWALDIRAAPTAAQPPAYRALHQQCKPATSVAAIWMLKGTESWASPGLMSVQFRG